MASQVLGRIIQTKDALYPQTASGIKEKAVYTNSQQWLLTVTKNQKEDIKLLISKKQSMSTCIYLIRTV